MKNQLKRYTFYTLTLLVLSSVNNLKAQLPGISTYIYGETAPGYIFLNVSADVEGVGYYIMMIDNDGIPFKYKELTEDYSFDFKPQPSGLVSYAQFLSHFSYTQGGSCIHMVLDEDLNKADSFQMGNDYIAEAHDFKLLPNGHALLFGYYMSDFDLSNIVEGGYPNAQVSGGIVQELDADKNVIWQWRSWDNYDYQTFDFGDEADNQVVSRFNLNSISLDDDNNILLATSDMSMKLNRQTGDVLWELGGDRNEFSFIGVDSTEGVEDVTGHTFHRIENGNFLIYDNGPEGGSGTSEVHEYKINEAAKTAEKISTFSPEFDIQAWYNGSAQRLPNGNTLTGWGGAGGDSIPVCTEYDTLGNKVLEVFFDNKQVESYRAVRYPFPSAAATSATETEIDASNSYDFMQGDTLYTGVSIDVNNYIGMGYNEVNVDVYDYAPKFPEFPGRAPMVKKKKVIVSVNSITAINGDINFDASVLGIANPEDITIYHRQFIDQGLFVPLSTSYNSSTGIISAYFNAAGEFIFAYPDLEHQIFSAIPVRNAHGEDVNYQDEAIIEWAPKGFFEEFELEIATDEGFASVVISEDNLTSTVYEIDNLINGTDYYWRVKTTNEAGTSDWSETGHFTATTPYVRVTVPNGDEVWDKGNKYFIEWESNIDEDLKIELYKDDALIEILDTVENTHAYFWEVSTELDSTCGYYIQLTSMVNSDILDKSNKTFAVSNATCTNTVITDNQEVFFDATSCNLLVYPNPAQNEVHLKFTVQKEGPVTIQLYSITGELLETVYQASTRPGEYEVVHDLTRFKSGIYLIGFETTDQQLIEKISLIP